MKPARLAFLGFFVFLGLIFSVVKLDQVIGLDFSFTLMNGFGPSAGAIIGPFWGLALVFLVRIAGLITGIFSWDSWLMFFSILPMAVSSLYFGTKRREACIISPICMILFWLHPIGREVWFFALYWIIPIFPLVSERFSLISKSLGATFTDHAVGSVFWLYAVNVPASAWAYAFTLVPFERLAFALGIALSYVLMVKALKALDSLFAYYWNGSLSKNAEVVPLEYKLE